jgi:hypothetical protein
MTGRRLSDKAVLNCNLGFAGERVEEQSRVHFFRVLLTAFFFAAPPT